MDIREIEDGRMAYMILRRVTDYGFFDVLLLLLCLYLGWVKTGFACLTFGISALRNPSLVVPGDAGKIETSLFFSIRWQIFETTSFSNSII